MRAPLIRPDNDRIIAGVCAGLAAHLGIAVAPVRWAMVVLSMLGGAGLLLYAWLWVLVPTAQERDRGLPGKLGLKGTSGVPGTSGPPGMPGPQDPRWPGAQGLHGNPGLQESGTPAGNWLRNLGPRGTAAVVRPQWQVRGVAFLQRGGREVLLGAVLLLLAGLALVPRIGLSIDWAFILPVAAISIGAVIAWLQLDEARRTGLMDRAGANRAGGLLRLGAGLVLVVAGVLILVSGAGSWDLMWSSLLASLAVLAGVGLVLAPWGLKFWRDLETERAGRVREAERAEIAAHLHDSVLQTLALIQNRAGSEQDVTRLARAQERELREWLYRDTARTTGQLADRIKAAAADVEDAYGHPVDVVVVGDAPMSARHEALVQAAREALLNAAKHAGGAISVYVEAGSGATEVFVRDRGPGFDPDAIPADRMGVRESLIGRMQRNGGTASIKSGPGGTEVQLRMPEADRA